MSHPNFSLEEMRCKDGSAVPKSLEENANELLDNLQVLRDFLGEAVRLNSGYRSPLYNKKIGGKPGSKHMLAMAGDITCKSKTPKQLHTIIEKLIANKKMKQGGLGLYPGFVHYDIRGTKARW